MSDFDQFAIQAQNLELQRQASGLLKRLLELEEQVRELDSRLGFVENEVDR